MLKFFRAYLAIAFFLTFATNSVAQEINGIDERGSLKRAHVFHIMFKDFNQASFIYGKLKDTNTKTRFKEFQKIAREKSIDQGSKDKGGDLGVIEMGEMPREFEDALFAERVREISKPIRSLWGWHLVYIDSLTEESISEICQKTLPSNSSTGSMKYQQALTLSRAPYSVDSIQSEVRELLGDDWSALLINEEGNLETNKLETSSNGDPRLISHSELTYSLLDSENYHNKDKASSSPAVCIRSIQRSYSFDCQSGRMYYDGFAAYELRGGFGRLVNSRVFNASNRQIVEAVSWRKGELIANVCNGRKVEVEVIE